MFELYLDSVDIEQVRRFAACLPLNGVTSNPTILANAGLGIHQVLPELAKILGNEARFHLQVVSDSVDDMVEEAKMIQALPYDMVVKVPATEKGLTAIKLMKKRQMTVLATAIYSTQQGLLAALSGADYLAPYVNRMDTMGGDGLQVVAELQLLISNYELDCIILPASFKNTRQVVEVMKLGVGAITVPVDVAAQMVCHPAVEPAVEKFQQDWQQSFGCKLSFES